MPYRPRLLQHNRRIYLVGKMIKGLKQKTYSTIKQNEAWHTTYR